MRPTGKVSAARTERVVGIFLLKVSLVKNTFVFLVPANVSFNNGVRFLHLQSIETGPP